MSSSSRSTPVRNGGKGGSGGYYADMNSPIASTPQRHKGGGSRTGGGPHTPATPSTHALSPMHGPPSRVPARKGPVESAATTEEEIFSPVLHYADDDVGFVPSERTSTPPRKTSRDSSQFSSSGTPTRSDSRDRHIDFSSPAARARRELKSPAQALAAAAPGNGHRHHEEENVTVHVDNDTDDDDASEASSLTEIEYEDFNPYLFIKLLPPYREVAPRTPRLALPKKSRDAPDITLVLDLDETLVHCSIDPLDGADMTFPVTFNLVDYQVYVKKRPYLDKFLKKVSKQFEVIVFTASQQVYASKLLDLIDPEHKYIHHRLYREACLNVEGNFIKDLTVLGRDLRKTMLVDNSPHAFGYQVDNGIPIESWFEDPRDTELLKLASFLKSLPGSKDIRPLLRSKFQLHRLVEEAQ
eukprot:gb/GECG01009171.1/.p1 GENE.gb/GECG01009171.1/~~gb/GECG01009171.1/.p1  ORF type:complete len:412 (+),score=41.85 gb/GECG01009171.1/:1-1236(+)